MKISGEGKAKGKKPKVEHIRIHRAANGFSVHHDLEPTAGMKNPSSMVSVMHESPQPSVFNSKQEAMDHVGGLMDQMGAEPDQEAPEQA